MKSKNIYNSAYLGLELEQMYQNYLQLTNQSEAAMETIERVERKRTFVAGITATLVGIEQTSDSVLVAELTKLKLQLGVHHAQQRNMNVINNKPKQN